MILNFERERHSGQIAPLSPILRDLRDYWDFSRAQLTLPLSENLFISDLVDEMPHVLLAYGEKCRFQVEFAGDAAARLLGGSPIGATTDCGGNLPKVLSSCILEAADVREPAFGACGEMQVLCLPFGGEIGTVDVVLVGLVGIPGANYHNGGTVISLVR